MPQSSYSYPEVFPSMINDVHSILPQATSFDDLHERMTITLSANNTREAVIGTFSISTLQIPIPTVIHPVSQTQRAPPVVLDDTVQLNGNQDSQTSLVPFEHRYQSIIN